MEIVSVVERQVEWDGVGVGLVGGVEWVWVWVWVAGVGWRGGVIDLEIWRVREAGENPSLSHQQ